VQTVPFQLGTASLVGTMHPHPIKWGQVYPTNCGAMAGLKYNPSVPATGLTNGRASDEDWTTSQTLSQQAGRSIPGYIIDYDGIYKYDGGAAIIAKPGDILVVTNGGSPSVNKRWSRYDAQKRCTLP
jgi:hypothetical protein